MLKFHILVVVVFVYCMTLADVALGAPVGVDDAPTAQILTYDNENIGINGYKFAFETSDGVSRKETATLKNEGTENEAISVQGTVSWTSPDGEHYTLNYLADENGFQPLGKHLPVAPETKALLKLNNGV